MPRARVRRIHIDTDPGLDDLVALALAAASPEIRLEGISTVAGNASIEAVTENARRFLRLAGLEAPLGRGAAGPLSLGRVDAETFHGRDGRRGVWLPESPAAPGRSPGARELLREELAEGRVEQLVALGPLTNIAALLREEPHLFEGMEILWMGGTLGRGNVTPLAEFNAFADPEAASIVLGSRVPVRVIGLEVTRQLCLRRSEVPASLPGSTASGRFLREALHALMDAAAEVCGDPCAVLHDPCAVAAAVSEDLFDYDCLDLEVRVEEGEERGRLQAAPGTGTRYAVAVRAHEVRRLLLERLSAWSSRPEDA